MRKTTHTFTDPRGAFQGADRDSDESLVSDMHYLYSGHKKSLLRPKLQKDTCRAKLSLTQTVRKTEKSGGGNTEVVFVVRMRAIEKRGRGLWEI